MNFLSERTIAIGHKMMGVVYSVMKMTDLTQIKN